MATPKSTGERIQRHMRPTKVTPAQVDMPGRVSPKKTANNDPHRGGTPILHNQRTKTEEQILALGKLTSIPRQNLAEAAGQVKDCKDLIETLIAVRFNDWREEKDAFINECGRRVSKKHFKLLEDGRLATLKGSIPTYDLDWLLDLRDLLP